MIPIHYLPSDSNYTTARPPCTFDVSSLANGATVAVNARSSLGWVFDINLTGSGQCATSVLEVTGGSLHYLQGFSGDETSVLFSITHDGSASQIFVTYNTRPD